MNSGDQVVAPVMKFLGSYYSLNGQVLSVEDLSVELTRS